MITPSAVILQLGGLGGIEWVIIIGIVILLIFGVRKIPELAKSFGKAQGEYEKAKIEMRKEVERIKHGDDTERAKLESIAEKLKIDYTNKTDEELRKAIETDIGKGK